MASKLSLFLAELKRRRVHRVGTMYALAGIGVIEGSQLVFEALGLPFIAWRFLSVLVLMGFPVALVLAWVLDVTPEGIRRTKHLTAEELTGQDLRGGNLRFWTVLVVGIALAVVSGYLVVFRHTSDSFPTSDRFARGAIDPVAAVFEFENLTGDSALAELGLVTQHQVTAGLSWAEGVAVIPAAAVLEFMRVEAQSTSLQRAAVDLGADILVTGIVTKAGDRLRFQAQITMLEGGDALPVIEVTGPSHDPMVGVEELENRVMGALVGFLSEPPHSRGLALAAPSYDAVRAYLLGLEMLESEDLFGGLRMLHEAYATDTTFLAPLVFACYVHQMFFDGWYAADSLVRILDSRRTEMSPDEQLSVDFVASALAGDWEGQVRAFRPLARHTPSARTPLVGAAFFAGRLEEALNVIEEIDSEVGESGGSPSITKANATLILGRYTEALEAAQEGRKAYPYDLRFRLLEAKALGALGRKEELRSALGGIERMETDELRLISPGWVLLMLASDLRVRGEETEAIVVAQRGIDWYGSHAPTSLADQCWLAQLLIFLDRPVEAEEVLRPVAPIGESELGTDYDLEIAARATLSVALALSGDSTVAVREEEWLAGLNLPYLRGLHTFWRGVIMANLGRQEEAVRLLRQGWEEGHSLMGLDINHHPLLVPLRGYEPFERLVAPKG